MVLKVLCKMEVLVLIFLLLFDFNVGAPSSKDDVRDVENSREIKIHSEKYTTLQGSVKTKSKTDLGVSEALTKYNASSIAPSKIANSSSNDQNEPNPKNVQKANHNATDKSESSPSSQTPTSSTTSSLSTPSPTTTKPTSTTTSAPTTSAAAPTSDAAAVDSSRDPEEVECEATGGQGGSGLLRNGLGDNSYFIWPDRRIPFVIDPTFPAESRENILKAVASYNDIFANCVQWTPRQSEVRFE